MINQSLPQFLKDQWLLMKTMPPKKRLEHLWSYYRYYFLAIIVVIAIAIGLVQGQIRANQDVLISGVFINTDTSADGYQYVSNDYWSYCGGDSNARADIIETRMIGYTDEEYSGDNAKYITQIDTLILAGDLDYMILDDTAFRFYAAQGVCRDITAVLSENQQTRLADKLEYAINLDTQTSYCAGLNLSGSSFENRFGLTAQPSYLVILSNADAEKAASFLSYFLSTP